METFETPCEYNEPLPKKGNRIARCGCSPKRLMLVSEVELVSLGPRRKHCASESLNFFY